MLAHSFDRFNVVTSFILPMLDDLKLSPIKYDEECKYLCNLDNKENDHVKENIRLTFLLCKIKTIQGIL